jgi:protease I
MSKALSDRAIAVLTYPGYQELEFWYPVLRAREEGARVQVVASSPDGVESYLGYPAVGDTDAADVEVAALDALVVPGSVGEPPATSDQQVALIERARAADLPVFAIGSGAQLVERHGGPLSPDRVIADADGLPQLVDGIARNLRS